MENNEPQKNYAPTSDSCSVRVNKAGIMLVVVIIEWIALCSVYAYVMRECQMNWYVVGIVLALMIIFVLKSVAWGFCVVACLHQHHIGLLFGFTGIVIGIVLIPYFIMWLLRND